MKENYESDSKVIFFCVVNSGGATNILEASKKVGVTGGTIFLGKGTVRNSILEFLGLNKEKKEILMMVVEGKHEEYLHEYLTDLFQLYKPNHGIMFSCPINRVGGCKYMSSECRNKDCGGIKKSMEYEVIFTVVNSGLGEDVVDAATAAGARGATIIDARGSSINEKNMFFSSHFEKEKEIVMIIIKKDDCQRVVEKIEESMEMDKPGRGFMFVLDVNKTSGLYSS